MFTGIVASTGTVESVESRSGGAVLGVATELGAELRAGDSVAVNGACLTAVEADAEGFRADVVEETLGRTSLGVLERGQRVNLELPLRATDRLGGHLVQGHVDATGSVEEVAPSGQGRLLSVDVPPALLRYVAEKGSVAIDGVSLTVAGVAEGGFSVALIPETLERTTLGAVRPGDAVNIEVDVVAKYVERLVVHA